MQAIVVGVAVLRAVPDNVWTQGSGRVGSGLGFGVRMDVASASGSLRRLVFRVWDF